VSGHEFIRAEKGPNKDGALAPVEGAGAFRPEEASRGTSSQLAKESPKRHEVSGHEFTRAEKGPNKDGALTPAKGAGAFRPDEALKGTSSQLAKEFPERHEVSGHEFTRAAKRAKTTRGFSPRGRNAGLQTRRSFERHEFAACEGVFGEARSVRARVYSCRKASKNNAGL
jgi:hypothetical protein